MMSNETSHAAAHTQTQSYEPAFLTENTAYDKEHAVLSDGAGNELRLDTIPSMAPYHSGMAALIQLGNWFDCLRECGYQDHYRGGSRPRCGKIRSAICRRVLRLGKHGDINACDPLFLVKYFNCTDYGHPIHDKQRYTSYCFLGVDPVNPFTGNRINCRQNKESTEQHIVQHIISMWNISGIKPGIRKRHGRDCKQHRMWTNL